MSPLLSCARHGYYFSILSESRYYSWQTADRFGSPCQRCTAYFGSRSRYVPSAVTIPLLSPLNFLTDVIIDASQGLDAEAINKARNIINSAVIQELEQEDLSRSGIYEQVIRRHVISHLQHLRISLFTVETLMSLYNEHAEKINAETA
jgi:hypothetical protein